MTKNPVTVSVTDTVEQGLRSSGSVASGISP